MENSDYLNLKLPDGSETGDFYNINDFNENFEAIDEEAKRLADGNKRVATGSKLSDLVTPGEYPIANVKTFEDAPSETLQNVDSRLQVSAINGKIYQELTQDQLHFSRTVTGSVASAWYCPELNIGDLQSKMAVVKSYVDKSPAEVQSRIGYLRADNTLKNSLLTSHGDWDAQGQHTYQTGGGKLTMDPAYAGYIQAVSADLKTTTEVGDVIFVMATFRSTKSGGSVTAGISSGVTLVANTDAVVATRYVAPVNSTAIAFVVEHASPAVAYEASTTITKPMVINLTKAFGKGFEPSLAEMKSWIADFYGGFYDSRPPYTDPYEMLLSMSKTNATNIGLSHSRSYEAVSSTNAARVFSLEDYSLYRLTIQGVNNPALAEYVLSTYQGVVYLSPVITSPYVTVETSSLSLTVSPTTAFWRILLVRYKTG